MPNKISRAASFVLTLVLALSVSLVTFFMTQAPAHAATISNITVTSANPLVAGQTNSAPIVVTFTAPTAMSGNTANSAYANLGGATWVTAPTNFQCGNLVTTANDKGVSVSCTSGANDVYGQAFADNSTNWPANTTWTITFEANTVVLPNASSMNVSASTFVATQGGALSDIGGTSVALTGYVAPSKTVIFNANGGSGTMTDQSASSQTALTRNAFTRSGYIFAGWAASATSPVVYADGASYPFTSSATLFAQWTPDPSLAKTGFDGLPLLLAAFATLALGTGASVLSRRSSASADA